MKIKIFFGSKLDGFEFPQLLTTNHTNVRYDTIYTLVEFLCHRFGVLFPSRQESYLRIDQFQQTLHFYKQENPSVFYAQSFSVDPISTAKYLLELRDELVLGQFDFSKTYEHLPDKILVLQTLEQARPPLWGFADAVYELFKSLHGLDNFEIIHFEPLSLLPPWLQHFFETLQAHGVTFKHQQLLAKHPACSDLQNFSNFLRDYNNTGATFKNDGSLQLVKCNNLNELQSMASLALTYSEPPLLYLPYGAQSFDSCLHALGIPTLGVKSVSKGRPLMQLFRSVSLLIWNPLDVQGLLEFSKLPLKPLSFELSYIIGSCLSQYPGIGGTLWNERIQAYFDRQKEKANDSKSRKVFKKEKEEYTILFERKRYAIHQSVPIRELLELFEFLRSWALGLAKYQQHSSLFGFLEVADQLIELLLNMMNNQQEIHRLALDQLIESLLAPIANSNLEREQGHVPVVFHPQNITAPVDCCWWMGFTFQESKIKFDTWSKREIEFLEKNNVNIQRIANHHAYENWRKEIPFHLIKNQLVLFFPQNIDGEEQEWHPLFGKLKALFGDIPVMELEEWFKLAAPAAQKKQLTVYTPNVPEPFFELCDTVQLKEQESCSNLETLLLYPHIWFLRSNLRIKSSQNNKLQPFPTFKGSLAHRLLEVFFMEGGYLMNDLEIMDWFNRRTMELLPKEGALFLEYGREPERQEFISTLQRSVIHLVNTLRDNGWSHPQPEKSVEGTFAKVPLNGRSDLVLKRNTEWLIVDYKWRGKTRLTDVLKNDEDYQLQMYAGLLSANDTIHTSYFILNTGVFLAKSADAIKQVKPTHAKIDISQNQQKIVNQLNKTIRWRLNQLEQGKIEIRTDQRIPMLDEVYNESLLDIIELPTKHHPFDEYLMLLGEVK